jgi:type II secretory pathway pseudopilin PulG
VVIAIIAVLIGLLIPAVQKVREAANRAHCQNNLKQIGLATQTCYDANGAYPPAMDYYPATATKGMQASPTVWILPYIEQGNLFNQIMAAGGPGKGLNWNGNSPVTIQTYVCPSDPTYKAAVSATGNTIGSFGSYGANGQVFGTCITTVVGGLPTCTKWKWQGGTKISDIPDGMSNTIFWSEKLAYCAQGGGGGTRWAANGEGSYEALIGTGESTPNSLSPRLQAQLTVANAVNCIWYWPSSGHSAGLQVGMGDGSVRNVGSGVTQKTFNIAFVPNDGLPLGPDW